MKKIVCLLAALTIIVLTGCSGQKQPTARVYQQPPEITACDDSLESYAATAGPAATFEDYRAIYEHFIEKYPNSTPLYRDYQSLFDGFDKTTEKNEFFKQLYEKDQTNPMAAYLYGRVLSGNESTELFRKATELAPDYFWGHFGYASRLLNGAPPDTAAAINEYLKCIEIDNSFPSIFSQLADIAKRQGNLDEALDFAKFYQVTSPENVKPIKAQCDILAEMGNSAEAEQLLVDFATANPENSRIRFYLIDFYQKLERYADLLPYQYERARMSHDPGEQFFEIAKTFIKLDQPDSAIAALHTAKDHGFTNYRRLSRNRDLEPLRSHGDFVALATEIKNAAEEAHMKKLASRKAGAKERKKEALAERLDTPAPDFSLANLEGELVSLADLRGKVVVLDFWATWCGPCKMTMPLLQDYVDHKQDGVEFFSVNIWESDTSKVRPFLADQGYELPILFGDYETADDFKISGIPTLFVIDKKGVIRFRHIGYSPTADEALMWQTESLL